MAQPHQQTQLDRYISFVLGRRWLIVLIALPVMVLTAAGVRFLTVKGDYRAVVGKSNPQLVSFDALENTYASTFVAMIAIAPQVGSVFTRETLAAIEELTLAAWTAPSSIRVDSLTNYSHSRGVGEDDLVVESLVEDAMSLSDAELARIEQIALNDNDITGRLVSNDGRVSGLVISFAQSEDTENSWAETNDYLATLLNEARKAHPDNRYYLTGNIVLVDALADAARVDVEVLSPFAFLLVIAATALFLRSLVGTLALGVLVVFILGTVMGFAGWLGAVFTPVSAPIPIIVMTIAVAYSIHIVTSVLPAMSQGRSKNEAIAESLRANFYPVFLTAFTTAIGFLSLNASEAPPFRVLGNFAAVGVLFTFLYSVTLLPAMLSILPLRARQSRTGGPVFFDRFGNFVVERRNLLLTLVALLTFILATGITRIELSDNWTRYFDERYEFRRDTDFIIENLTGLDRLEYSLESGIEGGVTDPDYLIKVDRFAQWFRGQPEVTYVQSFSDIMKRLNRNMHGDNPEFFRLPEKSELAAQYLLLYELSLPFGSDLNDRIDVAKSATRMTVVLRSSSSLEQRELDARAQEWLRGNVPEFESEATGLSMVFAHMAKRNVDSMLGGTIIAMSLISLVLILVLRSLRIGLISLIPNFVPAVLAFGTWGYLIGRVGLASSVVVAIAFGLIVDDTIHFLSKYLKSRREGHSATEAVRSTFRTVGRALSTTTAILSCGFLAFTFSGFENSWALGLLVTITILFALVADFLFLPPLLMAIDRRKA